MENDKAKMIIHTGARRVNLEEINALPVPISKGRFHRPIPHQALIHVLKTELAELGLVATREEYAIQTQGARLFGLLDLKKPENLTFSNGDKGLALGFRSGNDRSMAVSLVGGARVFVCDNMVLSGSMIVLNKRHTTNLNLTDEIRHGLERLLLQYRTLDEAIARLKSGRLSDQAAKEKIYDTFVNEGVLPMKYLSNVDQWYFHPPDEATDCQGRTLWGVHNAFTRTIKTVESPARQFEATVDLGRVFNLA